MCETIDYTLKIPNIKFDQYSYVYLWNEQKKTLSRKVDAIHLNKYCKTEC